MVFDFFEKKKKKKKKESEVARRAIRANTRTVFNNLIYCQFSINRKTNVQKLTSSHIPPTFNEITPRPSEITPIDDKNTPKFQSFQTSTLNNEQLFKQN